MTSTIETTDAPEYPMPRAARYPFDPPPLLRQKQQEARFVRVQLWDGSTPWLVTRYDDQRAVMADPRVSADPTSPGYPIQTASGGGESKISFILMDDPEHTRLRRMVTAPFTIRKIEAMRGGGPCWRTSSTAGRPSTRARG